VSNPYRIEGPAQISFSGGRSSGMMLCKIVEAHGGKLPDDVVVCFANTGKEREETLEFVFNIADRLGIRIHWIEYAPQDDGTKMGSDLTSWREVSFLNASRKGEPFAEVVKRPDNRGDCIDGSTWRTHRINGILMGGRIL
jgi:3'-phosphoadenosine 5'-phosphosulfate sulfotransferase (PAPS reductase)/FAD synthetase